MAVSAANPSKAHKKVYGVSERAQLSFVHALLRPVAEERTAMEKMIFSKTTMKTYKKVSKEKLMAGIKRLEKRAKQYKKPDLTESDKAFEESRTLSLLDYEKVKNGEQENPFTEPGA